MGETVHYIAFFIFAVITLGGGFGVVSTPNLFHASLFLLVSLFGVAGLFVLMVAPFLAAIQVLVYMGAIGILIIFAIMLTRGVMGEAQTMNDQGGVASFIAVVIFGVLALVLHPQLADDLGGKLKDVNVEFTDQSEPAEVQYETVEEMGRAISDRNGFVLPFELASILLTGAMIGAIVVAREDEA